METPTGDNFAIFPKIPWQFADEKKKKNMWKAMIAYVMKGIFFK